MSSVSTYTVYLHKKTFSPDENKRRKADLNVQLAMDQASAQVRSYGRPDVSEDWAVVIFRGPHDSSGRLKNRGRRAERRHYTVFGFLQVGGGTIEHFLEHWYMHVYVDEDDLFTDVRCGTSVNNSLHRNITANDMTFLSGSYDV